MTKSYHELQEVMKVYRQAGRILTKPLEDECRGILGNIIRQRLDSVVEFDKMYDSRTAGLQKKIKDIWGEVDGYVKILDCNWQESLLNSREYAEIYFNWQLEDL